MDSFKFEDCSEDCYIENNFEYLNTIDSNNDLDSWNISNYSNSISDENSNLFNSNSPSFDSNSPIFNSNSPIFNSNSPSFDSNYPSFDSNSSSSISLNSKSISTEGSLLPIINSRSKLHINRNNFKRILERKLCNNIECCNFAYPNHDFCSPYCKERKTNLNRTKYTVKLRSELVKIRKEFEKFLENNHSEEEINKKREELNEYVDKKTKTLKKKEWKKK
jgi:hypothetical protein